MRRAALLLLLCACTTARSVSLPLHAQDLHQLNEALADREVDLSFATPSDYLHVDAAQVHLSPGHPRRLGAAQGLLFGAPVILAGVAVGLSAALSCSPGTTCSGETAAPILVGAALGLVVAPLVGALIGHHDEVTFTPPR